MTEWLILRGFFTKTLTSSSYSTGQNKKWQEKKKFSFFATSCNTVHTFILLFSFLFLFSFIHCTICCCSCYFVLFDSGLFVCLGNWRDFQFSLFFRVFWILSYIFLYLFWMQTHAKVTEYRMKIFFVLSKEFNVLSKWRKLYKNRKKWQKGKKKNFCVDLQQTSRNFIHVICIAYSTYIK